MDSFPSAGQSPTIAFFGTSVRKPGIPRNRDRNRATIHEVHREAVICHGDVLCSGKFGFSR